MFTHAGSTFLAVANYWDGGSVANSEVVLYRWEMLGTRTVASTGETVGGEGFVIHQAVSSTGAIDAEYMEVGGGLLVIASRVGDPPGGGAGSKGNIGVYAWNETGHVFYTDPLVELACPGVFDVTTFNIGSDSFLGGACREDSPEPLAEQASGRAIAAAAGPKLWRWDGSTLILHQDFGSLQEGAPLTVAEDRIDVDFDVVSQSSKRTSLLGYAGGGELVPGGDGSTLVLAGLRGASGLTVFESDSGTYMAVAQSVCGIFEGETTCGLRTIIQPKSAVLQWDPVTSKFGELQAFSEVSYAAAFGKALPPEESSRHRFALRLDAGRVRGFEYVQAGDKKLLIAHSATRGPLIFTWHFPEVVGLRGVVSAVPDPDAQLVYGLGRADAAIVAVSTASSFDDVGSRTQELFFRGALSETGNAPENLSPPVGLSGGRSLRIEASGLSKRLVVTTGLFRDELKCGDVPPVSASPALGPPSCQEPEFRVAQIGPSTLPAEVPTVDRRGVLRFSPRPDSSGKGKYRIDMRDGGSPHWVGVRDFIVEVASVNDAPTIGSFVPEFIQREDSGGSLVFARNLTAGSGEISDPETLLWGGGVIEGANLFVQDGTGAVNPLLEVRVLPSGEFVGVITAKMSGFGTAKLRVWLQDTGVTDALRGDMNSSDPIEISLISIPRNLPPRWRPSSTLISLPAGITGRQTYPGFALDISPGSTQDAGQNLTFSLESTEPPDLFSEFSMDPASGTLFFEILRGVPPGSYQVSVRLEDDGDSSPGSFNRSFTSFQVDIVGVEADVTYEPNLEVLEQASGSPQLSFDERYFVIAAAPQDPSQLVTFSLPPPGDVGEHLFEVPPAVDPRGHLSFKLRPFANGVFDTAVTLSRLDRPACVTDNATDTCAALLLRITVLPVNQPPSFRLPPFFGVVQDCGPQVLSGFLGDPSSGDQYEDEEGQQVSYTVTVADEGGLFASRPVFGPDGTVHFEPAPGKHGVATVTVVASDDGGTENGGVDVSLASTVMLKVFPLPVVTGVSPALVSSDLGSTITVRGQYFGSKYSRGFGTTSTYQDVSVYVGGARCSDAEVLDDSRIRCVVSPGIGSSGVSVNVTDGSLSRSGSMARAVTQSLFFYGGSMRGAKGFLGMGPLTASLGSPGTASASFSLSTLSLGGSARALLASPAGDAVYVGGDFTLSGTMQVGNIIKWDGYEPHRLGGGVDGTVHALVGHRGLLYVGGGFQAVGQGAGGHLVTGGLAAWNESKGAWEGAGGSGIVVEGTVTSAVSANGVLFVGGRLTRVGQMSVGAVAALGPDGWSHLAGGVSGGSVNSMAAATGAGPPELFVGGTFTSAGGVRAVGVARWDGTAWHPLGDIAGGTVHAVATAGEDVFFGGDFTSAGGVEARGLVRYHAGAFHRISGGVDGSVTSLVFSRECLYIGGSFTIVYDDQESPSGAGKAARWCAGSGNVFEGLDSPNDINNVWSVVSASSDWGSQE